MKTKPFDIEEAKLPGVKLVTRDGRPAKLVAHVPGLHWSVVAHIQGEPNVTSHSSTGRYYQSDLSEEPEDLFIAVETKIIYVNIYGGESGNSRWWMGHHSEADAIEAAETDALAVAVRLEVPVDTRI